MNRGGAGSRAQQQQSCGAFNSERGVRRRRLHDLLSQLGLQGGKRVVGRGSYAARNNCPRPMWHASQGAKSTGRGFFMTDDAIDGLGSNALKLVPRSLEGGF